MSVDERETGSNIPASESLQNGFAAEVAKPLSLEQKQPPLVHDAGPNNGTGALCGRTR
jgi:hypothetical protein